MSLVFACRFLGYLFFVHTRWVGIGREGPVPSDGGTERTSLCLDSPGPLLVTVRKFGECVRRTGPCVRNPACCV